jgi:hypothetical protein
LLKAEQPEGDDNLVGVGTAGHPYQSVSARLNGIFVRSPAELSLKQIGLRLDFTAFAYLMTKRFFKKIDSAKFILSVHVITVPVLFVMLPCAAISMVERLFFRFNRPRFRATVRIRVRRPA